MNIHALASDDRSISYLAQLDVPFVVHGRASDAATPSAYPNVNKSRAIETAKNH